MMLKKGLKGKVDFYLNEYPSKLKASQLDIPPVCYILATRVWSTSSNSCLNIVLPQGASMDLLSSRADTHWKITFIQNSLLRLISCPLM